MKIEVESRTLRECARLLNIAGADYLRASMEHREEPESSVVFEEGFAMLMAAVLLERLLRSAGIEPDKCPNCGGKH